ncbi:MAG: ShlB/FhaC/HecB family hemolysin secretion/activation protein [Rouxiella aceris]|uniref:ShlB/FhaC/HecB family hemolysin secretion/activation protein n=1 Tax=Rouxiella aceris TaxID=2703884 RepID=UPI002845119E|nr:ShlB/FhaC/HecB family hemolysin secretion/activation protein [Rouxiella aceris]MDR3434303.1 ShlB/FhaC/HecB family hemolysin secretion/activation protein [Rouxiella aceris]
MFPSFVLNTSRYAILSAPLLFLFTSSPYAATPVGPQENIAASIDSNEQQRQQERDRALRIQNTPKVDIHLKRADAELPGYPRHESPCFVVKEIVLKGEASEQFQWALAPVVEAEGQCLGGKGIMLVISKVQNAILAKGFVTTRVMAQEQDLSKGTLTLTLQPGRIARVRFEEPVSWRGRLWNAIPASSGDILNLRDVEQGLENFKRVPSAKADIKIVPGQQESTSDLLVNWQEARPVRLTLGLDDSGSKSTGRYLGSTTLAIDAPFSQNDLFYANIGEDMFEHGPYGNRSHALNYFIPVGYWAISASYNDYTYHQNIPNANEVLSYYGESKNMLFTLSRLLFRDQSNKTTLNMRTYRRSSSNDVNGIEIEQQRRRTAGWELGLNQHSYLGTTTLDANISWRRGTGAFGATPAPEEATHSGSARAGILLGDVSLNQPFSVADQPLRYYTSLRGQWSTSPLTPQERLAIAGRYTVRGFDGEQMLSGEKGFIWRNELGWNVLSKGHEVYLAADYGRVDGPGTSNLVGHQLAGAALGVRGAILNHVSYDIFGGVPLMKPDNFHTSGATAGFSINFDI